LLDLSGGRRCLCEEGEALLLRGGGDGERRKTPDEDDGCSVVEGVRLKLTSPIDMVMLSGRVAVSAAAMVDLVE